jgi:hypothetical protein
MIFVKCSSTEHKSGGSIVGKNVDIAIFALGVGYDTLVKVPEFNSDKQLFSNNCARDRKLTSVLLKTGSILRFLFF